VCQCHSYHTIEDYSIACNKHELQRWLEQATVEKERLEIKVEVKAEVVENRDGWKWLPQLGTWIQR